MTEEQKQPTYTEKIEALLARVSKGEVIYAPPVPEPELHKKIREIGVQKSITSVFSESYDVPHYLHEEDSEDGIDGTTLKFVNKPSSYPDVDAYWKDISGQLQNIGVPETKSFGKIDTKVTVANKPETLRIQLVRDENNADRPALAFTFINGDKPQPSGQQISAAVNSVGLKVDRTEEGMKTAGNWIIADVSK